MTIMVTIKIIITIIVIKEIRRRRRTRTAKEWKGIYKHKFTYIHVNR